MRNRTLYHEQINESNLAFLLQKKGGTLEEYIDYAAEQVLPFTEEDEKAINDALDWFQQELESNGLELPDPGPITYVKSTMQEALGAGGYTSEGCFSLLIWCLPLLLLPQRQCVNMSSMRPFTA